LSAAASANGCRASVVEFCVSFPSDASAMSCFSLAWASRQSVVPSDCRNRCPFTTKCVCHVLPRFTSDILFAPFLCGFAHSLFLTFLRPVLVPPISFVLSLLLGFTYAGIADCLVAPLCYEIGTSARGIGAFLEVVPVLKYPLDQVCYQTGLVWHQFQREWRAVEQQRIS